MPPLVRRFREGEPNPGLGAFVIELNSPHPFDIAEFDRLASALNPKPDAKLYYLKWIARGERMVIFRERSLDGRSLQHSVVNYFMQSNGDPGPLQSAGHLEMFTRAGETGVYRRIYGHSMTLDLILTPEASNKHKLEVIKPALQEHFTVD